MILNSCNSMTRATLAGAESGMYTPSNLPCDMRLQYFHVATQCSKPIQHSTDPTNHRQKITFRILTSTSHLQISVCNAEPLTIDNATLHGERLLVLDRTDNSTYPPIFPRATVPVSSDGCCSPHGTLPFCLPTVHAFPSARVPKHRAVWLCSLYT